MKVHSILLAGGSSDRFNNEENKVYFPIGGKPALSWALETLDNSDKVDSIILVVRDEDWEKTNNVIQLVNPKKLSGVTIGGNTRHESEYQGLLYLKERPDINEEDLILIHDGARPLLPGYLLDELIDVAKKYGAVCTPDFFGYNGNLELQYRGRIRELKDLKPIRDGDSDLLLAMREISKTGNGPKEQIPSMGCNIKWK